MMKNAKKTCCCGVGADVIVIFLHAVVLGMDYTTLLSASSEYYTHLLMYANQTDHQGVHPHPHSTMVPNFSEPLCAPDTDLGEAYYSRQQTYWAIAQLCGCIAGIFLPKLVTYKGAFVIYSFLMALGNLLYGLSTAQLLDNLNLALAGRIIAGLGDGSIVLGLSYIPVKINDVPVMRTALVNYRLMVSIGTLLGSIVSIGSSKFVNPAVARISDDFSFNPANFGGFLLFALSLILLITEAIAITPFRPPTKKGSVASPHWSWKILAWLFFVFMYGTLQGAIQYAVAIFCFNATSRAGLQTVQAVALTISFVFAFLGAMTSSLVTGKCCKDKVPKNVNLQIVQWYTVVIICGLSCIYAAQKLEGSPSSLGVSYLMQIGSVIFFYSVTGLSAAKTPLFKKIVPRKAISATMPLYKICLDLGKAIGPYWTQASFAAASVDSAFAPYLVLFIMICVFLFTRGVWMTTPDTPREAFCYKEDDSKAEVLRHESREITSPYKLKRQWSTAAVTRGYAGMEFDNEPEQPMLEMQSSSVYTVHTTGEELKSDKESAYAHL